MKQKHLHILAVLAALFLVTLGGRAEVWKDAYGVNYEYTPGQSEASVKAGVFDETNNPIAGSPEASGDIVIRSSFVRNGERYTVTSIGWMAFKGCDIKNVSIPSTIKEIDDGAWAECRNLQGIYIEDLAAWCAIKFYSGYANGFWTGASLFVDGRAVTNLIIPEGVKSISKYAFCYVSKVTSVTIPSSVESIGYYAFAECNSLTTFNIPSSVMSIGGYNFIGSRKRNPWYNNLPDDLIYKENVLLGYKGKKPEGNLEIKDGTRLIAGNAFEDCEGLTSVIIPGSVTFIGDDAFSGCSGLNSILIPKSVTGIGKSAFQYCNGLNEVFSYIEEPFAISGKDGDSPTFPYSEITLYVPAGTKAKYEATEGWKDFKNIVEMEESEWEKYGIFTSNGIDYCVEDGEAFVQFVPKDITGRVVISSTVTAPNRKAYSVTAIGYVAFKGCRGITEIVLPNTIEEICDEAFARCTGLNSIEIPNSVVSIGKDAFYNCAYLKSVVIPNSVITISNGAFENCGMLSTVTIGQSVKAIGARAFYDIKSSGKLISLISEPFIIDNSVFTDLFKSIAQLYVPAGTKAKYEATDGWKEFKNIVEMEPEARELAVGDTFEADGITYAVTSLNPREVQVGNGDYQAIDTETTGEIIIPSSVIGTDGNDYSVTEIGVGAFLDCAKLTSVVIPNSVRRIMMFAFDNCYKLRAIDIPNSVTYIGGDAFGACHSLTSLSIPRSVSIIEGYAFEKCVGLTSITIPNSVSRIGSGVFAGCIQLKEVHSFIKEPFVIESNVFNNIPDDAILYVPTGTKALYEATDGWKELNNIIEMGPESEWEEYGIFTFNGIDYYVEDGKASVHLVPQDIAGKVIIPSSVTAPNGYAYPVTAVGDRAFMSCNKITEIELPNSITRIGLGAFAFCKFTSITIPNSTIEIGIEAFTSSALNSVTIPNSVTTIGIYAFACGKLKTIECYIQKPFAIAKETFNKYDEATLYVPAGTKALYEATDGWKEFKNIVEMEPEAKELAVGDTFETDGINYTVYSTNPLEVQVGKYGGNLAVDENMEGAITIPASVEGPDGNTYSVTSIRPYAFEGCKRITSVCFPNTIREIGDEAFARCTGLTSVNIPNSVTIIEFGAFYHCENLASIMIPNSVTKIGHRAFLGCYALIDVYSQIEEPFEIGYGREDYEGINLVTNSFEYEIATLYVPAGTKTLYETTEGWKEFKNIVEMSPYEVKDDGTAIVKSLEPDEEGKLVIPEKVEIDGKECPVTEIAPEAFKDNQNLVEVTIPGTVTTIGAGAFAGCGNLRAIYLMSATPIALSQAAVRGVIRRADGTTVSQFDGVDYETCVLYVPYGCGEAYRNAEGWKLFKHIVEMEDTGINGAALNDKGQMINDKWYDLNGRCISQPKKGVNILRDGNGKTKVIVVK